MEPCGIDRVGWVWWDMGRNNCVYYFYIGSFFGFIDMKKQFLSGKGHSNQLVDSYSHVSQTGLSLIKAEGSIT